MTPRVYKAGRYGFGPTTADALEALGYTIDASVVPHMDFTSEEGPSFAGFRPWPGTFGRGYFNLHGDSPIGGHIKAENCRHVAFVARPFMGRPSRSIQFFNGEGTAMFKIFVRRDAERNLIGEQVAKFDALREMYRVRLAAAE